MAAVPQQVVTVAQGTPSQSYGYSERYNATGGLTTGIIQLICAVLLIIIGVVSIFVLIYIPDAGAAIWGGLLLFLPSGILGIVSKSGNSCVIIGYMVMSILSCVVSFSCLVAEAFYAWAWAALCGGSSFCQGFIAVQAVAAILFLVEFIASLIGSIFCCGGVCCGSSNTTTTTTATTMVQYPAGAPVASQPGNYVVAPPQTGYGAPAPQYPMDVKY